MAAAGLLLSDARGLGVGQKRELGFALQGWS